MKTLVVTNAFSINMLSSSATLTFSKVDLAFAKEALQSREWVSAVGHLDTAKVFSDVLDTEVSTNRISIEFNSGVDLLVGQYKGPRLEEGATTLPEGATIEWWLVTALEEYAID